MISAKFLWGNVFFGGKLQIEAKNSNFDIFESALYLKSVSMPLSWFQTSLLLTAFLLRHLITACRLRVSALSSHAALTFSPSSIAFKLNRSLRSAAVCKAARLSLCDKWYLCSWTNITIKMVMRKYHLPQRVLAQLYKYHHQNGNAAS